MWLDTTALRGINNCIQTLKDVSVSRLIKTPVSVDPEEFVSGLKSITEWSIAWQLPISTGKSCFMKISNRFDLTNLTFQLGECSLNSVTQIKDLGVLFNNNLSFSNHITAIINKSKQRLFLLHKCFLTKNSTVLILAYKTYVLPILDYCSVV